MAGDDVLIGGRGSDILIGGLGADQFVFDIDFDGVDQVLDFSPEQGDTLILEQTRSQLSKLTTNDIKLNSKGELQVRLHDKRWRSIVQLHQPRLTFKIQQSGGRAILRFRTRF
jgi:hypothetical protein